MGIAQNDGHADEKFPERWRHNERCVTNATLLAGDGSPSLGGGGGGNAIFVIYLYQIIAHELFTDPKVLNRFGAMIPDPFSNLPYVQNHAKTMVLLASKVSEILTQNTGNNSESLNTTCSSISNPRTNVGSMVLFKNAHCVS